jgi:hypothetical protein
MELLMLLGALLLLAGTGWLLARWHRRLSALWASMAAREKMQWVALGDRLDTRRHRPF